MNHYFKDTQKKKNSMRLMLKMSILHQKNPLDLYNALALDPSDKVKSLYMNIFPRSAAFLHVEMKKIQTFILPCSSQLQK